MVHQHALTIEQFCQSHAISLSLYFKLRKEGLGPDVMKVGRRSLISQEAAANWRRRMEQGAARQVAA